MRTGILVAAVAMLALAGCATSRFEAEVTPVIVVAPGLNERLALMDAYRLNDQREVRVVAAPSESEETDAELRPEVREAPVAPPR